MNRFARLALCLIHACAIALWGMTQGVAAASAGVSEMVICSEAGAMTIWLDASGNPVEKPASCDTCPDCLPLAGSLPTGPGLMPPHAAPALLVWSWPAGPAFVTRPPASPMPRGPPSAPQVRDLPKMIDNIQFMAARALVLQGANPKVAR